MKTQQYYIFLSVIQFLIFFQFIFQVNFVFARENCFKFLNNIVATEKISAGTLLSELQSEGIKIASITKKTFEYYGDVTPSVDNYYLDITFSKLTLKQFEFLKKFYGNTSFVEFDPLKTSYNLSDFLPPLIQKLNQHNFVQESFAPSFEAMEYIQRRGINSTDVYYTMSDPKFVSSTNCYCTVYEIMRHKSFYIQKESVEFQSFWHAPEKIASYFFDPKYSIPVKAGEVRLPGDLIIISGDEKGDEVMKHAMIYLGNNLIFEKTGNGDQYAFRLAFLDDVLKSYEENGLISIKTRRFSRELDALVAPDTSFTMRAKLVNDSQATYIPDAGFLIESEGKTPNGKALTNLSYLKKHFFDFN